MTGALSKMTEQIKVNEICLRKNKKLEQLEEKSYFYQVEKIRSLASAKETMQCTEAEFLDVIGKKVLRVFLLYLKSLLLTDFTPPPPLEQKWFETGL
jgi:hypothetical protein